MLNKQFDFKKCFSLIFLLSFDFAKKINQTREKRSDTFEFIRI